MSNAGAEIKARLVLLGKKQIDLLPDLRKGDFPNMSPAELSRIINGVSQSEMNLKARDEILNILDKWENVEI